jgi:hypothetical protein
MELELPEDIQSVLETDNNSYLNTVYGALAKYCLGVLESRTPSTRRRKQIKRLSGYIARLPNHQDVETQAMDDHELLIMADRIDHEAYLKADSYASKVVQ